MESDANTFDPAAVTVVVALPAAAFPAPLPIPPIAAAAAAVVVGWLFPRPYSAFKIAIETDKPVYSRPICVKCTPCESCSVHLR